MKIFTYKIHLEPEPEGGFTVTVPALRGCVTYGKNYAEAVEMAKEAIEGFLEALEKAGQPIPKESSPQRATDLLIPIQYPIAHP
ncbi:MAG TPA: type II toxin-antitoxin system HicB family antitoxin [Candidatus Paceibacterota bacterium]